jgi:RNA polymerase sigma-70 factor (ECF subfamily)
MASTPQQVTQLLVEWGNGNQAALDQLMPLVYAELRKMAKRHMRQQRPGHALQTTALVHEAFFKLMGESGKQWENRAHFFGVAAQAMRHVLVDYARSAHAQKRGGARQPVALDEAMAISTERLAEVIELDDCLTVLAKLHPRQSEVISLRYFGGLSVEETAEALKVSPETVMRDWRVAKAWLHTQLSRTESA